VDISIDTRAEQFIEHRKPGHGVLITVLNLYALPGEYVNVEIDQTNLLSQDPDLIYAGSVGRTPLYLHRRLASFAHWHPVRLTTTGPSWWQGLGVEGGKSLYANLVRWEQNHPTLAATPSLVAA
jgi:hypothetical protein